VVLTGDMNRVRSDWERELRGLGLVPWSAVTKKVRLLVAADTDEIEAPTPVAMAPEPVAEVEEPARARRPLSEDSLVNAKSSLADALDELVNVLRAPDAIRSIPDVDRDNLAKYLTISKLRLENAIALVRSGDTYD